MATFEQPGQSIKADRTFFYFDMKNYAIERATMTEGSALGSVFVIGWNSCKTIVALSNGLQHKPKLITVVVSIRFQSTIKPGPNGTPNSSQLTELKLASAGGQQVWQIEPARKKTIPLSDYDRAVKTITKKVGESWPRWPNGGKRGSSLIGKNMSLIKFKPTRVKWEAKLYPTWTNLKPWLELRVPSITYAIQER